MDNTIILLVIIAGFAVLAFFLNKRLGEISSKKSDDVLLEWLKSMQSTLDETNRGVNQALRETNKNITSVLQISNKNINERLDRAARVIIDVQRNIAEMSEIGRSMRDLQEFLQSPKIRGNIGEQVLKELLAQMLPKNSFHLQYSFRNGTTVDAAIKTSSGIIPVDSKFPMENFRKMISAKTEAEKNSCEKDFVRDVKKHIDAIAGKYIQTDEGTIDYALMYLPSEAVYYEVINNPQLFDYSSKKRVLPVSPMTFYAYLRAILMGFEGQRISQKAQEILLSIRAMQKDYEKLGESLETLARHINNSFNMVNEVNTHFLRLGQKIAKTSSIEERETTPQIP